MKGTIDITIKRKDGTIEKRQEHNVAFDLPAFIIKEWAKDSVLPIVSSFVETEYLKDTYSIMSLCEEERNLTKPDWRPRALKTTTSGSSLPWHTALASPTNDGKKRTITAAWTMPSDEGFSLTLKSIAFDNAKKFAAREDCSGSNGQSASGAYEKGVMLCVKSNSYYEYNGAELKKSDFLFSNSNYGGLLANKITTSTVAPFMPYSLGLLKTINGVQTRTNDGRFAFVTSEGNTLSYFYPYNASSKLVIYDKTASQVALSFTMSQFTNYKSSNGNYTYVINTGTKNWLFQYDSSINASRIWQIPDTQTSDAIAPTSETFLQGVAIKSIAGNTSAQGAYIIGNYIINNHIVYKISDDLTVTTYKGVSSETEMTISETAMRYLDKDYLNWGIQYTGNAGYLTGAIPYFANLTASNFSTPITLAAGDVLSVSYSISVA